MDKRTQILKFILFDLVSAYHHILFGKRAVKQKQEAWKKILAELVNARLVNAKKDWKGVRQIWYHLTRLAKKSREEYLLGKIYDIPEFDKKLLMISGIPIEFSKEETSHAVNRLNNMENQSEVNSFETGEEKIKEQISQAVNRLSMENLRELNCLNTRDNIEITENKFLTEQVESKKLSTRELNLLQRKVNEQKFKLQKAKLMKIKYEIYNMKKEYERENNFQICK